MLSQDSDEADGLEVVDWTGRLGSPMLAIGHLQEELFDDVEAQMALSPGVFGRVIDPADDYARMRSPSSLGVVADTESSWETLSCDSNRVHEGAGGEHVIAMDPPQTVIHRGRWHLNGPSKHHAGKTLEAETQGCLREYNISPILFNHQKSPPSRTPSFQSKDSELDYSTPLFSKSVFHVEGNAGNQRTPTPSYLEPPPPPPSYYVHGDLSSRPRRMFPVLKDPTQEDTKYEVPMKARSPARVLQDTTNLPRPKYLDYNSFAQDKLAVQEQKGGDLHKESIELPEARYVERSLGSPSREQRTGLTSKQKNEDIREPHRRGRPMDAARPLRSLAGQSSSNDEPARILARSHALARLHGHVPPRPSSPIKRYAYITNVYDSSVEVEHKSVRTREPVPIRWVQDGSVVEQLERSVSKE